MVLELYIEKLTGKPGIAFSGGDVAPYRSVDFKSNDALTVDVWAYVVFSVAF